MNQSVREILSEIEQGPSLLSQERWDDLAEYLQIHPEEKKEAFSEVERILNDNGKAAPAYVNWIFAIYQKGDASDAVQTAERANTRYINKRDIVILWGMALRKTGDIDGAIEKYKRANELWKNKDFDALYNWGNALLARDDLAGAIAKYKEAKELKPTAKASYALALALQKAGHFQQAAAEFERASKATADGTSVRDIYFGWGKALLDSEQPDRAAEKYEALEKIFPNDPVVLFSWGAALQQAEKLEPAAEKYKRATENKKDYADAYYNWGLVLYGLKDWKGAAEKCELATKADPKYTDAYYNWALALLEFPDLRGAVEKFDSAIRLDDQYADAYCNRAIALIQDESFSAAIESCGKAIPLYEKKKDGVGQAIALYYWGRALERGSPEEAKQKYDAAVQADPRHVDALLAWGNLLANQQDEEAALKKFDYATERDRDFAFAWHNIAALYHRQGQYELSGEKWLTAQKAYERGLTRPNCQYSYFYYAFATLQHEVSRELHNARDNFQKACQLNPNFAGPRISLVRLYLELANGSGDRAQREDDPDQLRPDRRARYAAAAAEEFRHADDLLRQQIEAADPRGEKAKALLQRGELHLTAKKYDTAEKYLQEALQLFDSSDQRVQEEEQDRSRCRVWTELGVLYSFKGDSAKAIEHLKEARQLEPRNLNLRSYLADAYQVHGWLDKAELEYKRILEVTPGHVEMHIGLGETFMSLAEAGDHDLYADAIDCFDRAIQLNNMRRGSRRLANHELAAVHYYIGVARTKLWENRKRAKPKWLRQARDDFDTACRLDPENYQAARAKRRLEDAHLADQPERISRALGPLLIILASAAAFVLTQTSFFSQWPIHELGPGYYATLSFGMLAFMIVGLYLPQLLKLEVGGVKFEKSVTEPISKEPLALGLKWKAQRSPVLDKYLYSPSVKVSADPAGTRQEVERPDEVERPRPDGRQSK